MAEALQIGELVHAVIDRVESYGIYCRSRRQQILILIPEVRWFPRLGDCREAYKAGEHVSARIARVVGENEFVGSMKRVDASKNPFTNGTHAVGSKLHGFVTAVVRNQVTGRALGFVVTLESGMDGFLSNLPEPIELAVGAPLDVEVVRLDEAKEEIELAIIQQ